jgi:hypothetical protein
MQLETAAVHMIISENSYFRLMTGPPQTKPLSGLLVLPLTRPAAHPQVHQGCGTVLGVTLLHLLIITLHHGDHESFTTVFDKRVT